jgi:galactokinase
MRITKTKLKEIKKDYLEKNKTIINYLEDNSIPKGGKIIKNIRTKIIEEYGEDYFKNLFRLKRLDNFGKMVINSLTGENNNLPVTLEDCDQVLKKLNSLIEEVEEIKSNI